MPWWSLKGESRHSKARPPRGAPACSREKREEMLRKGREQGEKKKEGRHSCSAFVRGGDYAIVAFQGRLNTRARANRGKAQDTIGRKNARETEEREKKDL